MVLYIPEDKLIARKRACKENEDRSRLGNIRTCTLGAPGGHTNVSMETAGGKAIHTQNESILCHDIFRAVVITPTRKENSLAMQHCKQSQLSR